MIKETQMPIPRNNQSSCDDYEIYYTFIDNKYALNPDAAIGTYEMISAFPELDRDEACEVLTGWCRQQKAKINKAAHETFAEEPLSIYEPDSLYTDESIEKDIMKASRHGVSVEQSHAYATIALAKTQYNMWQYTKATNIFDTKSK